MVIHISEMKASKSGSKVWVGVYIRDASNNALAGATVTGQWSGGATGSFTCSATDGSGLCGFDIKNVPSSGTMTFTVTGVSLAGAKYDAAANVDTDGDGNGSTITI